MGKIDLFCFKKIMMVEFYVNILKENIVNIKTLIGKKIVAPTGQQSKIYELSYKIIS